jgi:quinoprotein glucose dehydrogenase
MKTTIISVSAVLFFLVFAGTGAALARSSEERPVIGKIPQQVQDRFIEKPEDFQVETWVDNLQVPWSLIFLPDGRALVSERPGNVRLIRDGRLVERPWMKVDVTATGEGGLMGLALHPDFPKQPYVYAMHTYREDGRLYNRVIRLRDEGETGQLDRAIIDKIPGDRVHNGGRIAFGPDGMLYVCTGDARRPEISQERDNLGGKILRLTPDGQVPEDNPFRGSPVYSLGHRNPQGLVWHRRSGTLFISDHGPSGEFGLRGHDLIKTIRAGGNYGWPRSLGVTGSESYLPPLVMWEQATPPAGMTFLDTDLYVATLRSESLVRIHLSLKEDFRVTAIDRLFTKGNKGVYGRLRDVVAGPDGNLYVLTSNRDGRGSEQKGDDRILKLQQRN